MSGKDSIPPQQKWMIPGIRQDLPQQSASQHPTRPELCGYSLTFSYKKLNYNL